MASISELDRIRKNPIKDGLDAFRGLFESRCAEFSVPISSDTVQLVFSRPTSEVVKDLVLDPIQALLIEPAARSLHSRIANRSLSSDLAMMYSLLDSNELDFSLAVPLMGQVLAVFELVAQANPLTTPNPFENVVLDTPLRSSSPSRWEVEQILEEIGPQITESENTQSDIYLVSRAELTRNTIGKGRELRDWWKVWRRLEMLDLIRRREKCRREICGHSLPLCWGVPLVESHKMREDTT
ncbi:hypothetical protein BGZ57DRAFT_968320 [Hyaloscypha finlandica]|nr:hypothetical protein BGZ57DRAFT_968320 [Hyaloscypha finlandica]